MVLGHIHCLWVVTVNARAQGRVVIFCLLSTVLRSLRTMEGKLWMLMALHFLALLAALHPMHLC